MRLIVLEIGLFHQGVEIVGIIEKDFIFYYDKIIYKKFLHIYNPPFIRT